MAWFDHDDEIAEKLVSQHLKRQQMARPTPQRGASVRGGHNITDPVDMLDPEQHLRFVEEGVLVEFTGPRGNPREAVLNRIEIIEKDLETPIDVVEEMQL